MQNKTKKQTKDNISLRMIQTLAVARRPPLCNKVNKANQIYRHIRSTDISYWIIIHNYTCHLYIILKLQQYLKDKCYILYIIFYYVYKSLGIHIMLIDIRKENSLLILKVRGKKYAYEYNILVAMLSHWITCSISLQLSKETEKKKTVIRFTLTKSTQMTKK